MPIARFQMPDGRIGRFEVPDGASPEQAQELIAASLRPKRDIAAEIASDPISTGAREAIAEAANVKNVAGRAVNPELLAANPVTRFALGAASPFIGVSQLAGEAIGDKSLTKKLEQIESMKKQGGLDGTDWIGAIGSAVSPAFLAAASKIPGATSYLQKIWQGMQIGGAASLAAPVTNGADYWGEKGIQSTVGTVVGGAIPALAPVVNAVGRGAYHVAEPLINRSAIKGRAYLNAAGDKTDDIIKLLQTNRQIVPGSAPTAGEAAVPAGRAEFAALQKSAEGVSPSLYVARGDEQNAARLAAIRSVGQDEAALNAAITNRSNVATPMYEAARQGTAPVDTKPILNAVDAILAKNPGNRELVIELQNIRNGLIDGKTLRTDPQEVASVIDGLKSSIAKKENAFIKGQLNNIKERLVRAIPGYEQAQQAFARESAPVNQMQVGQFLEQKLTPALDETAKQRGAVFAGAIREAPSTIKRATDGSARFEKLTEVLTPQQMDIVNNIRDDLARGARFEKLASKGSQAAPNAISLATESMESAAGGKIPGMLERGVMLANAIISRLEGRINKKLATEMAAEMLQPTSVAKSMQEAQARAKFNEAFAKRIAQYKTPAIAGAIQAEENFRQQQ